MTERDDPRSSAARRSINLVAVRDDSEDDELRKADTEGILRKMKPIIV